MSATTCRLFAMRDHRVPIEAINTERMYVVFAGGLKLPITNFFDEDNQPTRDLTEACYYEFGTAKMGYGTQTFYYTAGQGWEQ